MEIIAQMKKAWKKVSCSYRTLDGGFGIVKFCASYYQLNLPVARHTQDTRGCSIEARCLLDWRKVQHFDSHIHVLHDEVSYNRICMLNGLPIFLCQRDFK